MVHKFVDRVMEYGEDYGTGANYSFSEALLGFQRITPTFDVGDTFDYVLYRIDNLLAPTGEWESGLATVTGSSAIERTTIYDNSAGTAPSRLDFTSGFGNIIIATPTATTLNALIAGATGIAEAPDDGGYYARRNEGWESFTPGGGGGGGTDPYVTLADVVVSSPVASIVADVTGYSEVLVIMVDLGAVGGNRGVQVSVDGGTTYLSTAGNYSYMTGAGARTADQSQMSLHSTASGTGRSGAMRISNLAATGVKIFEPLANSDFSLGFLTASEAPVTHVRVMSTGNNLNSGRAIILGRGAT